jgi:glycosyltransferase involved in cell wall biosynthesis
MIPCLIHQLWKTDTVPLAYRRWQASWQALNPGFSYRLWTDRDIEQLIEADFPAFKRLFHSYRHTICRVDLARYLILKKFGGVYADLDFECLRPLDGLLEGRSLVLGVEPPAHEALDKAVQRGLGRIVCNAWIASTPGHPFWDHLLNDLQSSAAEDDVLDATGPFRLTRSFHTYAGQDVTLVEPEVLYPLTKDDCWTGRAHNPPFFAQATRSAYAVHYWEGTWFRPAASAASSPTPQVLILTPMKDTARHLRRYFELLLALDYPREHLSVGILEGDSRDGTYTQLLAWRDRLAPAFRRFDVFQHHAGLHLDGPRWRREVQLPRRSVLADVRNRLLASALADEAWVLWLDADLSHYPPQLLASLLGAGKDVVVPLCLNEDGGVFDKNTFFFKPDRAAAERPEYLHDGLYQPPSGHGRGYLDEVAPETLVPVDAVGGTALLVRADLHRSGLQFPTQSHRGYIETEGFAALAHDRGVQCWGLPQLRIVHAKDEVGAPTQTPATPAPAPEKISCLMVTRGNPRRVAQSMDAFLRQRHANKELLIVTDALADDMAAIRRLLVAVDPEQVRLVAVSPSGLTLGELRNIAVQEATGDYVCQWDDDDLHHPDRLAFQWLALKAASAHACVLSRWTIWWPKQRRLVYSNIRHWEGSLLCRRDAMPLYPAWRRGEDTHVLDEIKRSGRLAAIDMPQLYLYVVHGANTFDAAHFNAMFEAATERFTDEAYEAQLAEWGRHFAVENYPFDP